MKEMIVLKRYSIMKAIYWAICGWGSQQMISFFVRFFLSTVNIHTTRQRGSKKRHVLLGGTCDGKRSPVDFRLGGCQVRRPLSPEK